jgi:hypothetical protein
MNKRVKTLEEQSTILNSQLEAFTRQLANLQAQIKFNANTSTPTSTATTTTITNSNMTSPLLFNDFCDSARIAKKEGLSWFIFLLSC